MGLPLALTDAHSTSAAIDTPTIEGIASKPDTRGFGRIAWVGSRCIVAGVGAIGPVADEDENGA